MSSDQPPPQTAKMLTLFIVVIGIVSYFVAQYLHNINLGESHLFSSHYSGELCLTDDCLTDVHNEIKNIDQYFWQTVDDNGTLNILLTPNNNQIISPFGTVNENSSTGNCTNFSRAMGSFEFIYNKPVANIINSYNSGASDNEQRIHVQKNSYITEKDLDIKIKSTLNEQNNIALTFQGKTEQKQPYNAAFIIGSRSSTDIKETFAVTNLRNPIELLQNTDYRVFFFNNPKNLKLLTKKPFNTKNLTSLGESLFEINIKHLNGDCQIDFNLHTAVNSSKNTNNSNRNIIFLGKKNNNFYQEKHFLHAKNISFAPKKVRPEEHNLFSLAVKNELINKVVTTPSNTHSLVNRFINIEDEDRLKCNEPINNCIYHVPIAITEQKEKQKILNNIYWRPAGAKVKKEVNHLNQRKLNAGLFITSLSNQPQHGGALRDTYTAKGHISVAACYKTDEKNLCDPMPLNRVATNNSSPIFKNIDMSLADYYRIPFEHQVHAYEKVKWKFEQPPSNRENIHFTGSSQGIVLYNTNGRHCAFASNTSQRNQQQAAIYSLSTALKNCRSRINTTQALTVEISPVTCDDFEKCDLFKQQKPPSITKVVDIDNNHQFSWKLPQTNATKHTIASTQNNITNNTLVDKKYADISIYANNLTDPHNEFLKVFDKASGITDEGKNLGIANIIGMNHLSKNFLGGNLTKNEFQLTLRNDIQQIVNTAVQEKSDQLTTGNTTFNKFYNNGVGRASITVIIQNARNGEILAAADTKSQFISTLDAPKITSLIKNETISPYQSPLRWPATFQNQLSDETPGSVFKLVNALAILNFKASLTNTDQDYVKHFNTMLNGDNISTDTTEFIKNYGFDIARCHYPLTGRNEQDSTIYTWQNGNRTQQKEYKKIIHNYKSNRYITCSNRNRRGLSEHLKHSINTWFAFMHEYITPAILYAGEQTSLGKKIDRPREKQNEVAGTQGLLGLKGDHEQLAQFIPVANILHKMKLDLPINLITGLPDANLHYNYSPLESWILSPVSIKYNEIIDRKSLRRLSIGVGHLGFTLMHAATISTSLVNNSTIYPRLLKAEKEEENEQQDTTPTDPLALFSVAPIIDGMYRAANERGGTSNTEFNTGLGDICSGRKCLCVYAKTGTAPLPMNAGVASRNSLITGWFYKNSEPNDVNPPACAKNSKKLLAQQANIYSFSCAIRHVNTNTTGASGCGVLIAKIIKNGMTANTNNTTNNSNSSNDNDNNNNTTDSAQGASIW